MTAKLILFRHSRPIELGEPGYADQIPKIYLIWCSSVAPCNNDVA